MINSVLSKSVIPTAVAIGALCVGAGLAEAADYTQTNLVSDIAGLAKITELGPAQSLGRFVFRQQPLLGLGSGHQLDHPLRGDRQDKCH